MSRAIRIGMVGSGFMGGTHSIAYRTAALGYPTALPEVELRRIADATPELARSGAQRFQWQEATDDWREITRADDIDLVDIVTPNDSHAEIAIDAARHGKHIFCEKPLAPDAASARSMYKAVQEAGRVHQVDFVYRTWPAVQLARQLISQGEIGRVLHFRGQYLHDYGLDPDLPITWRFQRARAGAGSIGDLGSHVIDIARCLVGEIVRVLAQSRTIVSRRPTMAGGEGSFRRGRSPVPASQESSAVDVDDEMDMLMEFDTGALGSIETSWMAGGHNNDVRFEVNGTEGSIRFTWEHANEIQFYSRKDPESRAGYRTIVIGPMHPGAEYFWPVTGLGLGYGDAFLVSIRNLLHALSSGSEATPNFLDGLRACEVVEAAQQSADSGQWVLVGPAGATRSGRPA